MPTEPPPPARAAYTTLHCPPDLRAALDRAVVLVTAREGRGVSATTVLREALAGLEAKLTKGSKP